MSKLDKAFKMLDETTMAEMIALDVAGLETTIVEANKAMEQVQKELDENMKYQALLESKKAMEAGKKEVNKRQNAKIIVALHLLEEKGQ